MRSETFSLRAAIVCALFCEISAAQPRAAFPEDEALPGEVGEQGTGVTSEPQPPDPQPSPLTLLPPPPPPPPQAMWPHAPYAPQAPHAPPPSGRHLPRDEPREPTHETRWYGWQTLLADGAALLLLGAAVDADAATEGLLILSAVTYAFAPPSIHGVHGRPGAAFGSFALRIGGPLAGGLVGSAMCEDGAGEGESDGYECFGTAFVGVLAGFAGAIAIDAAVLARENVSEPARPALGVRFLPSITPTERGVRAGLSGVF